MFDDEEELMRAVASYICNLYGATPEGRVRNAVELGWHDLALGDILRARHDLPILIENDANAVGYGEWSRGAGVGSWRGWGRASPLSSRGSPWRLGTPTACAPGSPRVGIQWARRRGADHRSGNWDCVEQGTT